MWSWNQFRNLPKNQGLSDAEQARQYFIHQSNMMMEASRVNNVFLSSSAGGGGGNRLTEGTLLLEEGLNLLQEDGGNILL